jgi:hypothetical protein
MRSPSKSALFLTAVMTCLGGLAAAPGTAHAAPAPTVTLLPFTNPADVVSSGDRVFVSGGRDATQIVVTDATGAVQTTIDGLDGPTDLQLSNDRKTLYVAVPKADLIAAYDTGSLAQSATYATGPGSCPAKLAFTGRFVWFGYGCQTWGGEIGRIDLARQPATVTLGTAGYNFYNAPTLSSALRNNKVLFAGQQDLSPWTGYSYTIGAGGVLTRVSTTDHGSVGSNLQDAALDPTGTTVYTASGAPYRLQSFAMADLTQAGPTYETEAYPNAVELSRDGTRLAGGSFAWYDPDVFVFGTDGTPVAQFELGGDDHVLTDGGLAWAPNGRRLYAISNDGYLYQNQAQLHVLPIPAA